jgi:hypothetical protein
MRRQPDDSPGAAELFEALFASLEESDRALRAALPYLEPAEAVRLARANRQTAAEAQAFLDAELRRRAPNVRVLDRYRRP